MIMKITEMRIDRFNFAITADYKQFDSFSIGHESCIINKSRLANGS